MKKEIKVVDEKKGIIQITTTDERWYSIPGTDPETGMPTYHHFPSVSWILAYYPKGKFFENWLKKNGDDSELIKQLAGEKGSRIHNAIDFLISSKESLKATEPVLNGQTGQMEELSADEWGALVSFKRWVDDVKPVFHRTEMTVISEKFNFGGTVDCVATIGDQVYIIDFKTGQNLYSTYSMQVSAYKQALIEMNVGNEVAPLDFENAKLAILQVGYQRNKNGYKFTEVDDKFPLFLTTMEIWREEAEKYPKQIDYPLSININYENSTTEGDTSEHEAGAGRQVARNTRRRKEV